MNVLDKNVYLLQLLTFFFIDAAKIILVRNNSIVTLECGYRSTQNSLIWLGPQNLIPYTDGKLINNKIPKFHRLSITGKHEEGEYNLVIKNFTTADEGLYQCNTLTNGRTHEGSYILQVTKPPTNLTIQSFYSNRIYVRENQTNTVRCSVNPGIPEEKLVLLKNNVTIVATGTHLVTYSFKSHYSDDLRSFTCAAVHDCLLKPLERSIQIQFYTKPIVRIQVYPSASPDINRMIRISCEYSSGHPRVSVTLEKIMENNTQHFQFQNTTVIITKVQKEDSGRYRCKAINPAGASIDQITIIIRYKPILLTKGKSQQFYTELGLPVNITYYIESFEYPTVSWLSGTLQGKRDTWKVHQIDNCTYALLSTILPNTKEHFVTYKLRVRNSAGVLDADIQLFEDKTSISVLPNSVICNTSSSIRIACYLYDSSFRLWKRRWIHYRRGKLVRYLEGRLVKNVSMLEIDFCDYQDEGNYVCTWSLHRRLLSAEVDVYVKSEPIVTRKTIQTNHSFVILTVLFYSNEYPKKPTWFYNFNDELERPDIVSSLKNVDVEIQCYGKIIKEKGYQALLAINKTYESNLMDVSCQLLNINGRIETSFNATDIQAKLATFNVLDYKTESPTNIIANSQTETHEDQNREQREKGEIPTVHLYAIISGGMVLCLGILFTSIMVVILRTYKPGHERTKAEMQFQEQAREDVTGNVYEDIDVDGIELSIQEPYDLMLRHTESGPDGEDYTADNTSNAQNQYLHDSITDIHNYEDCEKSNNSLSEQAD